MPADGLGLPDLPDLHARLDYHVAHGDGLDAEPPHVWSGHHLGAYDVAQVGAVQHAHEQQGVHLRRQRVRAAWEVNHREARALAYRPRRLGEVLPRDPGGASDEHRVRPRVPHPAGDLPRRLGALLVRVDEGHVQRALLPHHLAEPLHHGHVTYLPGACAPASWTNHVRGIQKIDVSPTVVRMSGEPLSRLNTGRTSPRP